MLNEIRQHVTNDIIPFWKALRDDEHGGFYGEMDYNLTVDKRADKGGILNSRILWFFSNAYLTLGDESCLGYACHAFEFLKSAFIDEWFGGIYWAVTHDGKPGAPDSESVTKYTYNQAFAIYALASYYDASKDPFALELAYKLVVVIETQCRDGAGYLEAFDREWRSIENDRLSENNIIAHRTMNTLLHIFEAYTELYRVDRKPEIARRIEQMLELFTEKVYNPGRKRLDVFFDLEWNSIIDLCSYGHDIEASWLIDRGTDVLGVPRLELTKVLAEQIHSIALDDDGSVFNECEDGKVDTKKVWWVQSEALIGFLNAGYTETAEKIWSYIKAHIIDKRPGSEWLNELERDNVPKEMPIVNAWKCPYHNGRMCFEVINRSNG